MVTIFDTAKYILEKKGAMSPMKLQKLCYYSQAWNLAWNNEPLFQEDFEAWATGPVCENLHIIIGRKNNVASTDIEGEIENLSEKQKRNIDKVLSYYGDMDDHYLYQLSVMEEPYKNAHDGIPNGIGSDRIITRKSMLKYYCVR